MRCAIVLVLGVATVALGASVKPDGEALVSPHLIGGKPERLQDVPYAIRLKLRLSSSSGQTVRYRYCGGVRLNSNWFITAADCLDNEKYEYLYISFPVAYSIYSRGINIKDRPPVIHPQYNKETKQNDIGLINCNKQCGVPADARLLPVLPKKDETFTRSKPIVTGWTFNATAEDEDQAVNEVTSYETTMVNSFLCKLVYFFRSVSNEHVCTSTWGRKRITEEHVGVPLVVKEGTEDKPRLKLIGIASSVRPWTTKLIIPTVFTSIPQHSEWISRVTGEPIPN